MDGAKFFLFQHFVSYQAHDCVPAPVQTMIKSVTWIMWLSLVAVSIVEPSAVALSLVPLLSHQERCSQSTPPNQHQSRYKQLLQLFISIYPNFILESCFSNCFLLDIFQFIYLFVQLQTAHSNITTTVACNTCIAKSFKRLVLKFYFIGLKKILRISVLST